MCKRLVHLILIQAKCGLWDSMEGWEFINGLTVLSRVSALTALSSFMLTNEMQKKHSRNSKTGSDAWTGGPTCRH